MTQAIEQRGDEAELVAIAGERLGAITFVQDYLQLHFDGPAITRPILVADDVTLDYDSPGYRDRLCGLIGRYVARAYVRPLDRLQVDLDGHVSLIVSLKLEACRGAEAVIFSDGKSEQWAAW